MKTIKLNQRIGGRQQLGQGMTEYIIIVALIAVAAIGVYSAFGHTLTNQVSASVNAVAGNQSQETTGVADAKAVAQAAATKVNNKTLGMDNYTSNNADQ